MKIPFCKKEIVLKDVEPIDEKELTEEEKEELELKKKKKSVIGKIVLATGSFAGGVAAGVTGYKKYMADQREDSDSMVEIHTDDPEVIRAAFGVTDNNEEAKEETEN